MAATYFDMGKSKEEVREASVAFWRQVLSPQGMFQMAAEAVSRLPQPLEESVQRSERIRPIRERLGVDSAESQLASMLAAREVMEELAREFG